MSEPEKTNPHWKHRVGQLPIIALAVAVPLLFFIVIVFGLVELARFLEYVELLGYGELHDGSLRAILCVCVFFFVSLGSFSERLFGWRTGGFTQFLGSSFLAFVIYAIWYSSDSSSPYRDADGSFFFPWLVLSQLVGTWVWWRIRELEFSTASRQPMSQFTIASILIWFTFLGMFIALIQRSPAFPVPYDEQLINDPPVDSIVCALTLIQFLLPVTRWLLRSRHFLFDVAGVGVICFALAWVLFALIGFAEASYQVKDAYVDRITTFSVAMATYFCGLASLRRFLPKPHDPMASNLAKSPCRRYRAFSVVTVLLWSYLGIWFVLSFCVFSQRRSPDWADNSPEMIGAFEEAYGVDIVQQVAREHDPGQTSEWLNQLERAATPKESNVLFKIANLSKLPLDEVSLVGSTYRNELRFTADEVSRLPDETVESWFATLFEDQWEASRLSDSSIALFVALQESELGMRVLTRSQWTEKELAYAADFCRDRQGFFKEIREAIRTSEKLFSPILEVHGIPPSMSIERFASDMLTIDTRFAISEGRLEGAFKNLESLVSLAVLLRAEEGQLCDSALSIEYQVLSILVQIAEAASLEESEIERIEAIAKRMDKLAPRSKRSEFKEAANRMRWMQREFQYSSGSSVLSDRKLLEDFVDTFPGSVDWSTFTKTILRRESEHRELESSFSEGLYEFVQLIDLQYQDSGGGLRFGSQAMVLFSMPSARSKNLANHCFDLQLKKRVELIRGNLHRKHVNKAALKLFLYRNRHGEFPLKLAQLDGSCDDPFTGKPLQYYADGDRFELYSRGPNGIDDGGNTWKSDDLCFQWPDRTVKDFLKRSGWRLP